MVKDIKKRDGRLVPYAENKIAEAILKAAKAVTVGTLDEKLAKELAEQVTTIIEGGYTEKKPPTVEQVQDIVEKVLIDNGHAKTAKEYIIYRAERNKKREMNAALMKIYEDLTFSYAKDTDIKRENANIDADTAMGTMLKYGSEGAKHFNHLYLLDKEASEAHSSGDIHIHDLDFYALTETCCQIDLGKLFKGGFSTGHGFLREPNDIRSYAALACIAIQANQNDQHGGQSVPAFDYYMVKGVAKTFVTELCKVLSVKYDVEDSILDEIKTKLRAYIEETEGHIMTEKGRELVVSLLREFNIPESDMGKIIEVTTKYTDKATYQAMEAVIHNLNSMHSRAGAQVPFSSINFGTDITNEGRMIIKNLLLATDAGLGNGETPIFPISIFKVKEGINFNPGDPNYDLFKLACKVSAKRLFPNFSFIDAPFNLQYYKPGHPETEIAYMGCRTRVMSNVYDPTNEVVSGRGNLSFTSINLPRLAIKSKGDIDKFYSLLDEMLEVIHRQLLKRFKMQCTKKVRNYPFLMGQGVWSGSENLKVDDSIEEVLKQGSLSIGYIGLAETLVALIGKHHGESAEAQKLGLEIVGHMRDFCDKCAEVEKLNYGLIATPAEGLSGRFVRIDKKKYGVIKGVTDKEWYTNSNHVPVEYSISIVDKLKIEAPYHALTNAGHIAYVELDGDPTKNLDAFEAVVRYMKEAGIGYGAINHPVDRDPVCGYVGIIDEVCPRCGRRAGESLSPERIAELRKMYRDLPSCCQ